MSSNRVRRVAVDSRTSVEIKEGYPIVFEFATEEVVKPWTKMVLPKVEELQQEVRDMESPMIRLNFDFEEFPLSKDT